MKTSQTARLWTPIMLVASFAIGLLCSTGHAQTATEIMPGVTRYGGENGGTLGVEIMPGYRQYRGEINGNSVELMPGSRLYQLRPPDPSRSRRDDREIGPLLNDLYRQREASDRALDKALGRTCAYRQEC